MTTINLYAASIPDHSNTDESALEWAGSGVLVECETSEQDINTNAWREVGTVDGGTVTVWHDGCEDYCFEALETDDEGDSESTDDSNGLNPAILMLRDLDVDALMLPDWTAHALECDWSAAYDEHRESEEIDIGDMLKAIYWYCADCHGGQDSPEYELLSRIGEIYSPGATEKGDSLDGTAGELYRMLCEAAGHSSKPGETPDDFEPEITLAAGDVVVRMQYRDGGGSDRRGDYRFEITASGETWYGDELQSARCGFEHAAASVEAFKIMACSMLSFATTDDPEAECRAPDAMQDALESAVLEVSLDEDGEDEPTGWALVDHSSMDAAERALITWKIENGMDATQAAHCDHRGDGEFEIDGESWRVLDDSDADTAATEQAWELAWAFNASFLASYVAGGSEVIDAMEQFRADRCEDANNAVHALIVAGSGKDSFCEDAISADGRGHFLAGYDDAEQDQEVDGTTYYLYRTN